MAFDPDSLTSSKINDLRRAAEAAWGDDTRHESFIGHPQPSAGQCFTTAHWLKRRLGGHVGTKAGHFFWVSPDKRYVLDLAGDQHPYPPADPSVEGMQLDENDEPWTLDPHQKTWRPGPPMYKRADHPLWKGLRILPDYPDHERGNRFADRADAHMRGEHMSSYHHADLMGADPYQGDTAQKQEEWDLGAPMLHDEPDYNPSSDLSTTEYKFVFANGQVHVSPLHSHEELAGHAGIHTEDNGPIATGFVEVNRGHALWSVESNIGLHGLVEVLKDYTSTVGWKWDGMTDSQGQMIDDAFGPKQSMYYTVRKDGHLIMAKTPLPHCQRITIEGKTAYARTEVGPAREAIAEWAKDFGYKLAEYPGGGNMLDKMKNKENLDLYNRGDTDWQPEKNDADLSLNGDLTCGSCGQHFNTSNELVLHRREHEPDRGVIEDGHFPQLRDFDIPLGFGTQPMPNGGETIAHIAVQAELPQAVQSYHGYRDYKDLYQYETDPDLRFYGAYAHGQLVGYAAVDKPTIAVDFDGVVHQYAGWNEGKVDGEPMKGAATGLAQLDKRYKVVILTARDDLEVVRKWLKIHDLDQYVSEVTNKKPPAERYIDDRAVKFDSWDSLKVSAEIVHIDGVQPQVTAALLNTLQLHYGGFHTYADSEPSRALLQRLGMVNTVGNRFVWAAGQEPKDLIEDAIPFIYDINGAGPTNHKGGHIHIGYAGQRTSDIPGHFTPGGIVEGYYEPGGKVILISSTSLPFTVYSFARLWYHLHPQMEITSVELEKPDGKTHKLAANDVGSYIQRLVPTDEAAYKAYQALKFAGGKVYVVGGAVRDALQQHEPKDIDLMVSGLPPETVDHVLSQLPGRMDLTGKNFGVYRYHTNGQEVEVALPRTDRYDEARRGKGVITVDHNMPVEKDLERRDFTANSMAVDLDSGQLIDPYSGANDLEKNLLRTTHPDSFREDPTRLVRALTMHGRFGLNPDERTRHEMESNGHLLRGESPDAVNKILDKLFKSHNPAGAIRLGQETGVLQHLFPEVSDNFDFDQNNPHHKYTLGEHSLHVLNNVSEQTTDPDVRLAGLLHDIGKPASEWKDPATGYSHYYQGKDGQGANHEDVGSSMAESRLRALNYPVSRIKRITSLVNGHMYPQFSSARGARKFLQRYEPHADDLMTLRQADSYSKGRTEEEQAARTQVSQQRQLVDEARKQQAPTDLSNLAVNGNDLIAMGVPAGPQIGSILRNLLNDVVATPTDNEKSRLLQLAQGYIQAQPE